MGQPVVHFEVIGKDGDKLQGYYSELVRKSQYDFDSQKMRPYLPYDEVKQGVLDVASRMFSVTFKRVPDAPVWHPSVECSMATNFCAHPTSRSRERAALHLSANLSA